jgi:lipopolysaccharide transport system ATP-binding protein
MKMETRIRKEAPMNAIINSSTHPLTNSSTLKTPIIQVKHLSKRYQIGMDRTYKTFCESFTDTIKSPLKRLKSFSRQEETFWALKDINLDVYPGEVVGIIGRNGAGKSTLLKILSRITHPTEGEVILRGRVASLLEVGTGFHPELTGRENIYFNGAILGMTKQEIGDKFDEIVKFSGVKEFLDTPLKRYSSGMQVRLAFAVAAHLEPEILVVDEVLAVGDAAFQKKCLGKMKDVATGGRTVLFVSHNMAAVKSLCSRVFLLSDGKIILSGPTGQCIDQYLLSASDDMPAEIHTATLPRPSGVADDATLRITRIRFDTQAFRAILYTGQPITLVIDFQSVEPLEDVVFGWNFHSSDNVRLFECKSVDSYGPIAQLQPGRYSIQCTVPSNPVNPGLYTLHIGARCASKGLDYLPDVMTIRVDSPERYSSLWLELPNGLFRVLSNWTTPSRLNGGPRV